MSFLPGWSPGFSYASTLSREKKRRMATNQSDSPSGPAHLQQVQKVPKLTVQITHYMPQSSSFRRVKNNMFGLVFLEGFFFNPRSVALYSISLWFLLTSLTRIVAENKVYIHIYIHIYLMYTHDSAAKKIGNPTMSLLKRWMESSNSGHFSIASLQKKRRLNRTYP